MLLMKGDRGVWKDGCRRLRADVTLVLRNGTFPLNGRLTFLFSFL